MSKAKLYFFYSLRFNDRIKEFQIIKMGWLEGENRYEISSPLHLVVFEGKDLEAALSYLVELTRKDLAACEKGASDAH